jgi:hypothetical protein
MPLRHAAAAMYVTQETTADSIASSSRWSLAFKLSYSELIDSGAQRQQLSNYSKQKLPAVINVIATMAVTREKRCPDSKAQMLLISQLNCSRCHISQVYICCLSVFQTLDGGTVLRPLEGRH